MQNQTDEFSLACENVEVADAIVQVVPVHPVSHCCDLTLVHLMFHCSIAISEPH